MESPKSAGVVLYASRGPELTRYDVDVERAALTKRETITFPALVQEAAVHPTNRYLYVAWSNGVPAGGTLHGLSALSIDPASGALSFHGQPAMLRSRPIDVTTDISGTHALVAYNNPSGVTVHRILADGTVGSEVIPPAPLDVGVYGHQVRVDPSNRSVILMTRGNGPAPGKPEDPGAIKLFDYDDGLLTNRASIAPGAGLNYQPRHLDFHPVGPWVYVTLERQNKLHVYKKLTDQTLGSEPLFSKDTLAAPENARPEQATSAIHVHPNGKFVYLANRATGIPKFDGRDIFEGGENSIAVYRINELTGEPTLIQTIDTRGMHPRIFALDSRGLILVVANITPLTARDANHMTSVPANLAVFRVGNDGCLEFARTYDVETSDKGIMFWMGIVSLP